MTHDAPADANDRHVMREALGALERASERFRAIIPAAPITHLTARDLIADADHLLARLYRLTRAYQTDDDVAAALREYDGDAAALEQDLDRLRGKP